MLPAAWPHAPEGLGGFAAACMGGVSCAGGVHEPPEEGPCSSESRAAELGDHVGATPTRSTRPEAPERRAFASSPISQGA